MAADEEYVTAQLDVMKDEKEAEVAELKEKLDVIEARQKELKAELYTRFGNSINLDQ